MRPQEALQGGNQGSGAPAVLHLTTEVRTSDEKASSRQGGETRRILAALTQLGGMQVVVAFATLARNKALAVYLKPQGFGEFAQMLAIAAPLYLVLQCGMAVGLSRNVAAVQSPEERQRQLGTANLLTVMLSLVLLGILIPIVLSPAGNGMLSSLGIVPGSTQKVLLVVLFALGPLDALRNNYLSFLQGLMDIKGISARRSIAVLASTIAAIPLIAVFSMVGACIQTGVATLLMAVLLGMRCRQDGYNPLAFTWNGTTARILASFGAAALLTSFLSNSVDALVRARLIDTAGAGANGLYQAAFALSVQVNVVVLGSVGAYSLAVLSQSVDVETLQSRVENLLRVVLPVSTLGLGAVGLISGPLLSILYSPQFNSAAAYMPLLLVANYVQVATWALGAPVLGRGLIRYWVGVQLVSLAIRYAIPVLFISRMGGYAVAAGFLLGLTFDIFGYGAVCKRWIGIRVASQTALRFVLGAAAVVCAAIAGSFAASAAVYAGLTVAASLLCLAAFRSQAESATQFLLNTVRQVRFR